MKQPEHSDTIVQPDVESSAPAEHNRKNHRLTTARGKAMSVVLGILCVACCITIYVLANRRNETSVTAPELIPLVNSQSLEVEVLDGAGNMRAAQQMTNILRAQGFDVVEMKKITNESEERTFILDRSGNFEAAKKLATILGISPDKVFQKIDRTKYLDITVVMGKDYSRLKVFQSSTERKIH